MRSPFARFKWPGWFAIIFALITWVPDWQSRIQFWLEAAKKLNSQMALIASVLASRWFSAGLLVFGLGYLFLVGEPKKTLRHPIWPVVGWTVLVIVALTFWSVMIAGYVAVNLPHSRRITEKEKIEMAEELKAAGSFSLGTAQLPDADSSFAAELVQILKKAGWEASSPLLETWGEPMRGLNILVPYSDGIPVERITFVPKSGQIPAGAEALARVLMAHHVEFIIHAERDQLPDTFLLLFGSRP